MWYVCDMCIHVCTHTRVCVYKKHMQEAKGGCQELSVYLHLFSEAESVLELGACVFSTPWKPAVLKYPTIWHWRTRPSLESWLTAWVLRSK